VSYFTAEDYHGFVQYSQAGSHDIQGVPRKKQGDPYSGHTCELIYTPYADQSLFSMSSG